MLDNVPSATDEQVRLQILENLRLSYDIISDQPVNGHLKALVAQLALKVPRPL